MKKRLEADLMSIAHKILQIKDKSDVTVLFIETRRLYEKLAILRFVEEHFGDAKPTIGQAEVVEKMKHFFEEYDVFEFSKKTNLEQKRSCIQIAAFWALVVVCSMLDCPIN